MRCGDIVEGKEKILDTQEVRVRGKLLGFGWLEIKWLIPRLGVNY